MTEYIDKEAFKRKYLCCGYLPEMSEEEFDAFPAADVEPTRHSRWWPRGNIVYKEYSCGWCGHVIRTDGVSLPSECPVCHVRMDNAGKEQKHGSE